MSIVSSIVHPAKEMGLSLAESPGEKRGQAAFDATFREHYPRIVAMLARLTGDRGQAEEIASDTFCKLSSREKGEASAPWLYRVATNAGLDALRMNARRRSRERAAHAESVRLAQSGCALEQMLREERRARVQEILSDMKPRDAQLLLLRAEGLAYRELAETLGVQATSVGTLLARAEVEFERKFRSRYGDAI
ncbi:MAG TPA: sigma-70 family RNA polymerase sigma factor, partial [Bryobacteraceae bacterium]|jgi:RNA polymerase sigma factor (sigma-70 family)|nr:sigma-70 family RNA polymerase sigma factor [Bryobacteraceae bacterium]